MLEILKPAIALLDRHQKPYDMVYTNFAELSFMKMTG